MTSVGLINILSVGATVLLTLLWIRLLFSRLWRFYPWFTAYIFSLWLESGLLLKAGYQGTLYQNIWITFRLVDAVLVSKVVLEIFGQWTRSFPGIGAFGRRLVILILVIATAVAITILPVGWPNTTQVVMLKVALVANRSTNMGFGLFLLLTLGFFWKFGGPVAPNLKRHTWAMAVYVAATSASYFIVGQWAKVGNELLPAVTDAALLFWIFALSGAGERQPETARDEALWEEAEAMNVQMQKLADAVRLSPQGLKKG
jgi:hypothetical protein